MFTLFLLVGQTEVRSFLSLHSFSLVLLYCAFIPLPPPLFPLLFKLLCPLLVTICDLSEHSPLSQTLNIANLVSILHVIECHFLHTLLPACSQGLYKAVLGNTRCQSCPANSTVVGAVTCNCTRGHYRMHGEGIADPCTSKLVGVLVHYTM